MPHQSISDVSVYTLEVRDPYGYGDVSYTSEATILMIRLLVIKVRVTDASGNSFDIGATRKEDLFYYDDMDALSNA